MVFPHHHHHHLKIDTEVSLRTIEVVMDQLVDIPTRAIRKSHRSNSNRSSRIIHTRILLARTMDTGTNRRRLNPCQPCRQEEVEVAVEPGTTTGTQTRTTETITDAGPVVLRRHTQIPEVPHGDTTDRMYRHKHTVTMINTVVVRTATGGIPRYSILEAMAHTRMHSHHIIPTCTGPRLDTIPTGMADHRIRHQDTPRMLLVLPIPHRDTRLEPPFHGLCRLRLIGV